MKNEQSERTCVYDIVRNGEVIYVGLTADPKARMAQHRARRTVPKDSVMVVHRWYEDKDSALFAERERQDELQPTNCQDVARRNAQKDRKRLYGRFNWDNYAAETGRTINPMPASERALIEAQLRSLCKRGCRPMALELANSMMEDV